MPQYTDVNSYLLAVALRQGRTVMVEGPSDRAILHALLAELGPAKSKSCVIDQVDSFSDPAMTHRGNKEKAIHAAAEANKLLSQFPGLKDSFRVLVDRDWEGLCSYCGNPDGSPFYSYTHFVPHVFTTLGHSMENYFLTVDTCCELLKVLNAGSLTQNIVSVWQRRSTMILAFAVAYSWAVTERGLISKTRGLLRYSDLMIDGETFFVLESLGERVQERGYTDGHDVCKDINQRCLQLNKRDISSMVFCVHGALGLEAFRCCCAFLAIASGCSQTVAERLASWGDRDGIAACLCRVTVRRRSDGFLPLREIIEWLLGRSVTWGSAAGLESRDSA